MNVSFPRSARRAVALTRSVAVTIVIALAAATTAAAHEGHDNLPSSGVEVRGNIVRLSPAARASLAIKTEPVVLRDLYRTVSANATVEAPWYQQSIVTTLVSGRVEQVLVRPGDHVQLGQELARVESLELENLQLTMLKATDEIALASHMLEQRERLGRSGNIAERRLLESRAAREERIAELDIVTRKLLALGFTRARLDEVLRTKQPSRTVSITSPRAGYVSAADVRTGQFIEPTDHLYHIVDLSKIWVHADVLETDAHGLELGQSVMITLSSLPGETRSCRVHHIDLKADRTRRTLPVTAELSNTDQRVKPGMFGRMHIRVGATNESVACPTGALLRGSSGPVVLVEDKPGVYERRALKLGLRMDDYVEVLDGLFPGDPVVTDGGALLNGLFSASTEAAPVNPPNTATPTLAMHSATSSPTEIVAAAHVELPTFRKVFASSTISGRAVTINVEHGQRVERGAVLAEVQSLELRTLELDLLLARTRRRLAQQSLARYQQADTDGVIAEKDIWQLQTDFNTLNNTVASLVHKLALVGLTPSAIAEIEQFDLSTTTPKREITGMMPIRAPAAGWVVDFDLVPGQVVSPNMPLFEIHDLSRAEIQGFVFENDAARVHVGQTVAVTIAADPEFRAAGRVLRFAPVLNTADRVLSVWTELENPNHLLRDGMLARMVIDTRPAEPAK